MIITRVKTFILILDKANSRKFDNIFFAKVKNDGFSFGAQRTVIDKNDLSEISSQISKFLKRQDSNLPLIDKENIIENKDVSLNKSIYRLTELKRTNFTHTKLKNQSLFEIVTGGTPKTSEEDFWNGNLNWISLIDLPQDNIITNISSSERKITEKGLSNSSAKMIPANSVVVSTRATIGRVGINRIPLATNQGFKSIVIKDLDSALPEFVAYMMTNLKETMAELASGSTFKEISKSIFEELSIPLPLLEVQQEIVDELERYQKIIDGCKQVVENYKPSVEIDLSWEMVELNKVVQINPRKSEVQDLGDKILVSFVPMEDLNENQISFNTPKSRAFGEIFQGYTYFKDKDVLLAKVTPCFENGKAGIARNLTNGIGFGSSEFYVLRCLKNVVPEWIYINITTNHFRTNGVKNFTGTSGLRRVPKSFIESYRIPVPSIEEQNLQINRVMSEIVVIDGNKKLIEIYTHKFQDRIRKVWGDKNHSVNSC